MGGMHVVVATVVLLFLAYDCVYEWATKDRVRFSLRTLLIVMTVAAITLGLMVCAAHYVKPAY
jgi:hypothetical protein